MPASNLEEAAPALRAPFASGEEQYRAGPTWEQDGARWTRPLAYIDARAVFDRLDQAVGPANWHTELERLGPGCYVCRLTVFGTIRSDVGQAGENESEKEKSGASDAIKRVAVQYGIGAYLYAQELAPTRMERKGNDWVLPRGWRPGGRRPPAASREEPAVEADGLAAPGAGSATAKQIAKIGAEMSRVGWGEERGREYLLTAFGKKSRRELTAAEASALIDTLIALPAKPAAR